MRDCINTEEMYKIYRLYNIWKFPRQTDVFPRFSPAKKADLADFFTISTGFSTEIGENGGITESNHAFPKRYKTAQNCQYLA